MMLEGGGLKVLKMSFPRRRLVLVMETEDWNKDSSID